MVTSEEEEVKHYKRPVQGRSPDAVMSVDKFGHYSNRLVSVGGEPAPRGPPGIGFQLTSDSDYDISAKRLHNVQDPHVDSDAMTLGYAKKRFALSDRALMINTSKGGGVHFDAKKKKISNVQAPTDDNDVVTLSHLESHCPTRDEKNKVVDLHQYRLIGVMDAVNNTDAVNRQTMERFVKQVMEDHVSNIRGEIKDYLDTLDVNTTIANLLNGLIDKKLAERVR